MSKISSLVNAISFFFEEAKEIYAGGPPLSVEELQFADFLSDIKRKYPLDLCASEILLIPLINDIAMMKMAVGLGYKIASEQRLLVKYFYIHTAVDHPVPIIKYLALIQYLKAKLLFGPKRLMPIYKIRKRDILISNYFLPKSLVDFKRAFQTKNELVLWEHEGVLLGDILYDSYLRFMQKPTVDLDDRSLYRIVDYSKSMVLKWKGLLSSKPIKKILLPYTAYLHWGIPSRVALSSNVDVITYGSLTYMLSRLSNTHPYHSKDHNLYRNIFNHLDSKDRRLKSAHISLSNRLGGGIDAGTSYMKSSAFHDRASADFFIEEGKPSAIIFLHCFFDSPHIYGYCIFPDFYEWILFLLDAAEANPGINYYVKPHPNGLPGNDVILTELVERYKSCSNIQFIDSSISNKQILEQRPAAIFTVYGTVAHEFAYHGIPVITAGENPHSPYKFLYNPKTPADLNTFISTIGKFGLPEDYDQNEIIEFFYMHYMYYSSIFDQDNFGFSKDFSNGTIFLPENASVDDLMFN